jgi:catechol 2,3-dioxygenase
MASTLEALRAPIHIEAVTLRVGDIDAAAAFYADTVGMDVIARDRARVALGSGGVAYLHLLATPDGVRPPVNAAGLFHVAFVLPDRRSLGAWLQRAALHGVHLDGASDHAVSEAIYLADPEGNGIEIYVDRPRSAWRKDPDGGFHMTTERMDVQGVMAAGREAGPDGKTANGRFPAGARIGHVHLKVGDAGGAEAFYVPALGLDVTHARPPHAVFMSSGGYHHHIAANTWLSRGAGRREKGALGLGEVALGISDPGTLAALLARHGGDTVEDPWGNALRFVKAEA